MTPKRFFVPVVGGCNSKSYLELVDGSLPIALGDVNVTKDMVASTGLELTDVLWEEGNRAGSGFLRGVELVIPTQKLSELGQTAGLASRILQLVEDLQCFFCPLDLIFKGQ